MLSCNDPPLHPLPSLVVGPSTKSDYWCWVLCSTIAVNAGQITSMTHSHVIGAHRSRENSASRGLLPFLSLLLQLFMSLSPMVRTDISVGVTCSRIDGLKWYLRTDIFSVRHVPHGKDNEALRGCRFMWKLSILCSSDFVVREMCLYLIYFVSCE
jgi:hypothetical protein